MIIIGQEKVKLIIARLALTNENKKILLIAPSGHGKTLIGRFASRLFAVAKNKKVLYFSTGDQFENFVTHRPNFEYEKYVLFVDEIHLLRNPEVTFPLFEVTDIVGATNIMGLPEALQNRFINLPLEKYSKDELKKIFELYYEKEIEKENFERFLRISSVPRKLKDMAFLYKNLGEDFWGLVATPDGFTQDELEYINALSALGGQSSFGRIRAYLGYAPKYIQQIDVQLIEKGVIRITSKGRELLKAHQEEIEI